MFEQLISLRDELFQGRKIRFRPVSEEDKPAIKAAYADSRVSVGSLGPHFHLPGDKDLDKMLESWEIKDSRTGFFYAIEDLQGQLVGDICLYGVRSPLLIGTIALSIHPDYQLRGYGYEAVSMALRLAFGEYNAHKVELSVYAYNDRAVRLYRKLGFQEEGRRRASVYHQGRFYDSLWMGILREEWEASQK